MIKVTIEASGVKSVVEIEGDHTGLVELLQLVKQAILGAGFVPPEGDLQFINEDGDELEKK